MLSTVGKSADHLKKEENSNNTSQNIKSQNAHPFKMRRNVEGVPSIR